MIPDKQAQNLVSTQSNISEWQEHFAAFYAPNDPQPLVPSRGPADVGTATQQQQASRGANTIRGYQNPDTSSYGAPPYVAQPSYGAAPAYGVPLAYGAPSSYRTSSSYGVPSAYGLLPLYGAATTQDNLVGLMAVSRITDTSTTASYDPVHGAQYDSTRGRGTSILPYDPVSAAQSQYASRQREQAPQKRTHDTTRISDSPDAPSKSRKERRRR